MKFKAKFFRKRQMLGVKQNARVRVQPLNLIRLQKNAILLGLKLEYEQSHPINKELIPAKSRSYSEVERVYARGEQPTLGLSSCRRLNTSLYQINIFILLLVLQLLVSAAYAIDEKYSANVATLGKMRLASSTVTETPSKIVTVPVQLPANSQVLVISNEEYRDLILPVSNTLQLTKNRLLSLFKDVPSFKTNVRLMDEAAFYKRTGAPAWTNAMYYHGEIIIPIPTNYDLDNLIRSIKHEFSHAAIHAMSDGKCPGWLDEGFAQWLEGSANPGLKPALLNWLSDNKPVPIDLLQNGFTRLNPNMVPAAYAQSLFAANLVTQSYGHYAMARYLSDLRNGIDKEQAFIKAFGVSSSAFENKLGAKLQHWHALHR